MDGFLNQILAADMFASMVRLAVPVAYAALGAMFCERSGVINIGLEGQLLASSFFAILATYYSGSPLFGVMAGLFGAMGLSAIFGFLAVRLRGNQIIVGTGINIAAVGLFGYLSFTLFNSPGVTPTVTGVRAIAIPFLSEIPWIGEALFTHTPTVFLLPVTIGLSHVILYHTPLGLRIRVSGDNPIVDESAGVNVYRIRMIAILLSG